jgi:hypothetical protein
VPLPTFSGDDGIERADLVEMDFVDRGAVNGPFDLAKPRKERLRAILARRTQTRPVNQRVDLGQGSVGMRFGRHTAGVRVMVRRVTAILAADLELRRPDACPLHPFGPDGVLID